LVDRAAKGHTLNKAKLSRLPIRFPRELAEQRRISAILDKADGVRRKRERTVAMADKLLKSAFLDMLGDPRTNPKMWRVRELSKQASVKIGYPFQSKLYSERGVRLCRGANVLPGKLDWSDVRYWPERDAPEFDEFALEEGDVILALDRPWISSGLKVAQVNSSDLPALLVQRVARIRGNSRAHSDFIYQALLHPSFWEYCKPTETTVPHISPVELRDYPLIEPGGDVLERFGSASNTILSYRQKLNASLGEGNLLFGSLSQRAFRGKL
jgi:type I restriction enzyme S subunit